eukprot:CAMPEP_0119469018 /NCGR_PEP_ID=MMETSP1344-20130328/2529_1 /TAXON_ID=236787 /ORGANISM="Florenciella parvula, Strain CCMP2471" /LENGTH=376 /DNA_ID=CAMNT_0007501545 /DNA_START=184 /DNA_END=1311 /DNA_ORIENTATION=+
MSVVSVVFCLLALCLGRPGVCDENKSHPTYDPSPVSRESSGSGHGPMAERMLLPTTNRPKPPSLAHPPHGHGHGHGPAQGHSYKSLMPRRAVPPPRYSANFSIYISGEPGTLDEHANKFDLILANEVLIETQHDNIFWLGGLFRDFQLDKLASTPAAQRPIDLLYQSSHCDAHRDHAVSILRQAIEKAGMRFEHSGLCFAGSTKARTKLGPSAAKMMIAFPRSYNASSEALDEKLALPMTYGAVPVYRGNGQRLAMLNGFSNASWIDRKDFLDDTELAWHVVDLAKQPEKLDQIREVGFVGLALNSKLRSGRNHESQCLSIQRYVAALPKKIPAGVLKVFPGWSRAPPRNTSRADESWADRLQCVFGENRTFAFEP